ncbi:YciI family protein [Variovorax sp. PAMC26660]|uniref:YciI family protein n=1 Tax=Variovorax sp. PAMC26660 TaxID=2762322 RepID=UPI00164E2479|nr:YciI family protein [Variovorax sp. PAMC26660]QNK66315.1 YciI family protein [Variovorax sp. PAMC26660]
MRYLCLIYGTEDQTSHLSPEEMDMYINEHIDYDAQLHDRGKLVVSEALQSADTATTVRMRGNKLSVTDGPFAETSEQLGGFYLVEADSEEEALQLAAGIPSARFSSIEVRPVKSFARSQGEQGSEGGR